VRRERVVRSVISAAELGNLPEPPRAWRQRAVGLAQESRGGRVAGRVRSFLARILRDTRGVERLAPLLRGEGPAERHLLFSAGPFEVDLALIDSGALVGQVHAKDGDTEALKQGVCVLYTAEEAREAALDKDGDFQFLGVAPGAYDLVLETPKLRLFLPDVDLRVYGESA
jgi:hypothetical protein